MSSERGSASVEWVALVMVVTIALGAVLAAVPAVDGRSLGASLTHAIVCTAQGGCDDGDDALTRSYGASDAALLRSHAPGLVYEPGTLTLPVDWRRCRSHRCSDGPDRADLDVHRSRSGAQPATAFTHVVRRDGQTYLQYWLNYPDSTSTVLNAAGAWNRGVRSVLALVGARAGYPGHHADDWESYQVRLDAQGRAMVRASSHHEYRACKYRRCRNRWTQATGWTRVSRGSHAGHIPMRWEKGRLVPVHPGPLLRERTTSAAGLRLVPLEKVDRHEYRPLDPGITPPWEKEVYTDPESNSTG